MAFRSFITRRRLFSSSIPGSDSIDLLPGNQKSRAALAALRFEKNPENILEICRAAVLNPKSSLDRIAFFKAISKLKESQRFDGIRSIIKEAMVRSELPTERFVSRFFILYGKAGLVKDAIDLFDEMPEMGIDRNVKTMNSLLFCCFLAGECEEMQKVFMEFPKKYGFVPNLDTYNIVLKGFCDFGKANVSHSILAEMERKGVKPNLKTFATVLAGFYAEEKFFDVGKITELMRKYSISQSIGIYNVRIQSLCKLKRSNEARALLNGILSRGIKPNSATFTHLIHGFCREDKLDSAKKLFQEMVDLHLNPEAECYFTLIYYLCQGSEFKLALDLCEDAIKEGWFPNFSTMKALVDGLVETGEIHKAKKIIKQVKEKFSRNTDKWLEIEQNLPK